MTVHTVVQGEWLSKIAKSYGFADWRTIYNHPSNEAFRQLRPNPDLIFPGDQINIPDEKSKTVPRPTAKAHRFLLKVPVTVFRAEMRDPGDNLLSKRDFKLTLSDGQVIEETTDKSGRIAVTVPFLVDQACLEIGDFVWNLNIGHLNPIDENTPDQGVSGAQGRLTNLGYRCGPIDGIMGKLTSGAIKRFQKDNKLTVNGELDGPTRVAIVQRHQC